MDDTRILGEAKKIKIKSPVTKREISFTAFLTGFSDDMKSNWDRDDVYGRQDPISSFQNTQRSISFSIDIVSSSVEEAVTNADKIWKLQRMLYPGYKILPKTNDRVVSKSPLIGVYFYPYITEYNIDTGRSDYLWGTVDGISMNPNFQEGFVFYGKDKDPYFKSYTLDITLNVIHRNELGKTLNSGEDLSTKKIANKYAVKGTMGKR